MELWEMSPEMAAFFRFLRANCEKCGSADLSWSPAEALPEMLRLPVWVPSQRESMRWMVKQGYAREGVWASLCLGCGDITGIEGGVL